MTKRHSDAIAINWGGGANPGAITRSLLAAMEEARSERETTAIADDPAVRLILHQLCHLAGIIVLDTDGHTGFRYEAEMDACCALSDEKTLEQLKLRRPLPGAPGSSMWNPERRAAHVSRTTPTPADD